MNYSLELVSSVLFFAGLVVIYNLRSIIENDNKISFDYMTIGLSTLALCSVASVLAHQNIFSQIPLLNIPLLFQIIYWIGMFSGVTLLLSGVSSWLPISRKALQFSSQEFKKLELFKKIEQLIRFETRNNVILFQALEMITKQYNFNEVGCFLFSQKDKNFVFLGAVNNNTSTELRSRLIHFHNTAISDSVSENNLKLIYLSETHLAYPDLMLPIIINNKLLGAFSFYAEETISTKSISNLKLIIEILATKLYEDSKKLQYESIVKNNSLQKKIDYSIDSSKSIKDNIAKIKLLLESELSVDFLSISFQSFEYNPKCFISENNQVLEDFTNTFSNKNEIEKYVFETNQQVVINNLDIETNFIVDLTALQNDMKSILAYPIRNLHEQIGVIVIGSKKYQAYSKFNEKLFEMLQSKLELLILNSQKEMNDKTELRRQKTKDKFIRSSLTNNKPILLYQQVSDTITKELKASLVRISLFDADKRFLNSQAMSTFENDLHVTPADATMMLMLMPFHRKVLQVRESIIVKENHSNSEDFQLEQRQMFGNALSQFIITPFYNGSNIVGVISIGYTVENIKLSKNDIRFVEDMASVLSINYSFAKKSASLRKIKEQLQLRNNSINEQYPLHNIKSSLSSIIGSVELMKETGSNDSKISKYISLIDKSTQRMTKVFQEELVRE